MGALFAEVFQLLSFFPEESKLKVSFRGPAHHHIQEGEFVVCHDMKSIFLFGGQVVRSVCPYFRGELKLSLSCRRVHHFLKLVQPVFYLILFILSLENHQAVISIDAMVDCRAENRISILKEVKN